MDTAPKDATLDQIELESLMLETSASLVDWFAESMSIRDFDEPTPDVPIHIRRKITDEIVARGEESIHPLTQILNHDDWAVRSAAATALGQLNSVQAVPALIERLRIERRKDVQAAVANALHNIGDPEGLATVQRWRFQEPGNDDLAFRTRMNDFITLGFVDKALLYRLRELAALYNVAPEDIAASCLTYTATERQKVRAGDAAAIYGGLMLTEAEYSSIEEASYIVR